MKNQGNEPAEKPAADPPAQTNIKGPTPAAARGTGTTIAIDLKEAPELLAKIRERAKAADRDASSWLRRRLVALHKAGHLLPKLEEDEQQE